MTRSYKKRRLRVGTIPIHAFPKIFSLGTVYIRDIFKEEVEITEKVDGSMFVFGKVNGVLCMRSKGRMIYSESLGANDMFRFAVEFVLGIEKLIPDNTVFYCEYLQSPRHNILSYSRTPKNCLVLFGRYLYNPETGAPYEHTVKHETLETFAELFGIETVPLLYRGKIKEVQEALDLLERESFLGGCNIEGIVIKNYNRPFLLGGQPIPFMAGKFVSEEFKEKHNKDWKGLHSAKGKFQIFKENLRTEARWEKAIQHLREENKLENSPKDIGNLIREVHRDIEEEEKEFIKNFLWTEFRREILGYVTAGLPEWYKEKLTLQEGESNEKNESS